ncbi:MAG: tRNA (adenosine(37)-N6)-threonylcarbamoyltransferase complex ATPase subunit type 1 TsaE [Acidobacteriota bacterium]
MRILSRGEEETVEIGRAIGKCLEPPRAVLLIGNLGSGKTVLARGIAEGYGIDPTVVVRSPTFSLVNLYPGRKGPFYHLDLFRLEKQRDFDSIGLEEILFGDAIVVVEWAEKLPFRPQQPLTIRIHPGDRPETRLLQIEPAIKLDFGRNR